MATSYKIVPSSVFQSAMVLSYYSLFNNPRNAFRLVYGADAMVPIEVGEPRPCRTFTPKEADDQIAHIKGFAVN